jgi:5-methylcytosine-specific restriction endonuclease McrA
MADDDPQENPRKDRRAYNKAYYAANRDRLRAKAKARAAAKRQADPEAVRTYGRVYRRTHAEINRARARAWAAAHPERVRARVQAWKTAHQEEKRAYNKAWEAAHPEHRRAARARYYRKNIDKYRADVAQRRAAKAQAPLNDLTPAQWRKIQERYDHRCAYCQRRAKGHLPQDHITPLSQGGAHTAMNIVPACKTCNSRKQDRPPLAPVQPLLLTLAPAKAKTKSS